MKALSPAQVKSLYNKYTYQSIVLEGKGVDRYITEIEFEDGTPLTAEELDCLSNDYFEDHGELIECKFF